VIGREQASAEACLRASLLLRRRIGRHRECGRGEEETLLAVGGLLDALSRELAADPQCVPEPVRRAAVRVAEQLDRAEQWDRAQWDRAQRDRAQRDRAQGDRTQGDRTQRLPAPRPAPDDRPASRHEPAAESSISG
jgi:hypothetical protein